jgi:uncharacterized protein (DUF2147 family)
MTIMNGKTKKFTILKVEKTYSCYMSLKDKNILKVRGYAGISWFGRTELWS